VAQMKPDCASYRDASSPILSLRIDPPTHGFYGHSLEFFHDYGADRISGITSAQKPSGFGMLTAPDGFRAASFSDIPISRRR